jgi:hypothetical protein
MRLQHKTPCAECPWRRVSPPGWCGTIGDEGATFYADAVVAGEVPACHGKDYGPDDERTAFCAGALAVMANSAMLPYKQEHAAEAVKEVGRNPNAFAHASLFFKHHTGKDWVHPLLRGKT